MFRENTVVLMTSNLQASQNERGAQLKADIGFPTPPPTPQKTLSNGKTAVSRLRYCKNVTVITLIFLTH